MADRTINTCDECGSSYFADTSRMASLCPECAHWLYGHGNCRHSFTEGRCTVCHWDGSRSAYVTGLASKPPALATPRR